jgi:bifunctional non-homologous end joining protein LigD
MTPTIIQSTTLHFREGRSDKVYQAAIEEAPGNGDANGYIVTFAYGRRGATLKTGTKTPKPVSQEKAVGIHERLVASKQAKGYRISAEPGTIYHPEPVVSPFGDMAPQPTAFAAKSSF